MYEVLAIVKNCIGDIIGYDVRDINTGEEHPCIDISNLRGASLNNAMYINGKYPYIKGKRQLRTRQQNGKLIIFHGSNQEVKNPMYGKGKDANDYGQGFYTTSVKERAEEWALLMNGDSICNEYQIDTNDLKICDLDYFGPLAWIAEVLKNRGDGTSRENRAVFLFCKKYCIDLSNYDIIYGYRADDSYFTMIKSFIGNQITVNEVVQFFYKAKLGKQIFIKSERAFQKILFIKSDKVSQKRLKYAQNNDNQARSFVKKFLNDRNYDLLTGSVSLNDEMTFSSCLQRNYSYCTESRSYYESKNK